MTRSCRRNGFRSTLELLGAIAAALPLAGCRAPPPPNDPFLYRSTVPPPGTITPGPPGQAYYSAPAAIPGPAGAPPAVLPGTQLPPSTAPLGPGPVTPGAPPSKYTPPGGFNYQSSLRTPSAMPGATNGVAGPVASGAVDPSVVAVGNWQTRKETRADGPASDPAASQPRPEPSIVRIVEASNPVPVKSADASPAVNTPANAADNGSQAAAAMPAAQSAAAATAAAPIVATGSATAMPATISTAAVTATPLPQTVDRPSNGELTDLPPATAAPSAGAQTPASAPAPVNIPAERPGAAYGYDPDYKTLRGKLEYSVAARRWKLIYLPSDGPIDEFGGTVVLPDPSQLSSFEAGDFVTVQGTFSAPTAGTGAAMFAIQRIKRQ